MTTVREGLAVSVIIVCMGILVETLEFELFVALMLTVIIVQNLSLGDDATGGETDE